MKDKKDVKKIIENMKKANCEFPGCEEKGVIHCSLPVLQFLEQGKIKAREEMAITVPFCQYHSYIAMSGLFGVVMDEKTKKFRLYAPIDMINIAETVIHSMIATGKLQKTLKSVEEAEKRIGMRERDEYFNSFNYRI